METTELSVNESQEMAQVFEEAKDFRSIGEKITAPIEDIIASTAKVIDNDPIMCVSDELSSMNSEVQTVYGDIVNTDGKVMQVIKTIPGVGGMLGKIDNGKFNMKSVEGKLESIFSGFDASQSSVNKSIDLQVEFLEGIEENAGKVGAYQEFLDEKIKEVETRRDKSEDEEEKARLNTFIENTKFFQGNLKVLVGNLELAKQRLHMRLDSANKLSLAMNSSRPIFKTLLSTALIETSSQKAIDASMKAMQVMGSTIDKMSTSLTTKAIASSKKAGSLSSQPSLSSKVFVDNVLKLKGHFDTMETLRLQASASSESEQASFNEAKEQLDEVKLLGTEGAIIS